MMSEGDTQAPMWSYQVNLEKRVRDAAYAGKLADLSCLCAKQPVRNVSHLLTVRSILNLRWHYAFRIKS
jgi:hypothetical protein